MGRKDDTVFSNRANAEKENGKRMLLWAWWNHQIRVSSTNVNAGIFLKFQEASPCLTWTDDEQAVIQSCLAAFQGVQNELKKILFRKIGIVTSTLKNAGT